MGLLLRSTGCWQLGCSTGAWGCARELLKEETGLSLLSSSLEAGCASSHQSVTAAIALSREEKMDSTFLELVDVALWGQTNSGNT